MLGFETLTLAPIDRRLIDPGLLEPAERAWLDAYHARVPTRSRRWSTPGPAAGCAPPAPRSDTGTAARQPTLPR